jgi:hypothetical protein
VALSANGGIATASGAELAKWAAPMANDGVRSLLPNGEQSRWSSNYSDSAWLQVQLAAPTVLDHVTLRWEAACAAQYKIQVSDDGAAWTDEHLDLLGRLLAERGPLTAAAIREALPALDARVTRGTGAYQAEVAISGRIIVTLAATGAIVRGENAGGWKLSRPRWTTTADWLGETPDPLPEPEGYAALVAAWLRAFGPGTEADLVWWLGATKAAVRRALGDVAAVPVSLDSGATGWLLPDDLDPVLSPGPWAALLPALDPTTMGWKERDFHLGPHAEKVFDRNGNGGPTAWWDGRVVGVWFQRDDGVVEIALAEEVRRAGQRALAAEATALTEWLDGDVVRSIYLSPLARERLADGR